MHHIVERIELYRKKLNLSQKELCKKCNIIDTTYSSWKNRNRLPSIEDIIKLTTELNISLEWLITGKESKASLSISEDEQRLLDFYKQCCSEGQSRIMEQAEFIAQKYPRQEEKLSTYKIG